MASNALDREEEGVSESRAKQGTGAKGWRLVKEKLRRPGPPPSCLDWTTVPWTSLHCHQWLPYLFSPQARAVCRAPGQWATPLRCSPQCCSSSLPGGAPAGGCATSPGCSRCSCCGGTEWTASRGGLRSPPPCCARRLQTRSPSPCPWSDLWSWRCCFGCCGATWRESLGCWEVTGEEREPHFRLSKVNGIQTKGAESHGWWQKFCLAWSKQAPSDLTSNTIKRVISNEIVQASVPNKTSGWLLWLQREKTWNCEGQN